MDAIDTFLSGVVDIFMEDLSCSDVAGENIKGEGMKVHTESGKMLDQFSTVVNKLPAPFVVTVEQVILMPNALMAAADAL